MLSILSRHFRCRSIRFSSCLTNIFPTQFQFNRPFRIFLYFSRSSSHYPKSKGFYKGFFINNYKSYFGQSTNNPNKLSQIKSTRFNIAASPDSMPRILNVAEKPDAARTISQILSHGNSNRREGLSPYNKIFEFECEVENQQCSMLMTSVLGHLLNYEFSSAYSRWQDCDPVELFDAPLQKLCIKNNEKVKESLEREIRRCDKLIIWTDCDREGENIGFEVLKVCRAVFNALRTLTTLDKAADDAVDVRQELDLRIGAAFTRLQTLRLRAALGAQLAAQKVFSYGPCQFPTLGLVVDRYKQVAQFIPEPFWSIKASYEEGDAAVTFHWKRGRLFDHSACLILFQRCLENPEATVVELNSKEKRKWRPQAMDTVVCLLCLRALERLAVRKLRLTAKRSMEVAEKLYQRGLISYPRTETTSFGAGLNLTPLVEAQCAHPEWGAFASRVLNEWGGPRPREGSKSDAAHPPIHPTRLAGPNDTFNSRDEELVYELVTRHFLACVSCDALGHETSVEVQIGDELFSASGLRILERNYLEVYKYEKWSEREIPEFRRGQKFQTSSLELVDSETSPPKLLTEADLISLMEKHGIGTDATHAEHIETIKTREYVGLTPDSRLTPSELGIGLVEGYDRMMLDMRMSDAGLRAELERDLRAICEGRMARNEVRDRFVNKYRSLFIQAQQQLFTLERTVQEYISGNVRAAAR